MHFGKVIRHNVMKPFDWNPQGAREQGSQKDLENDSKKETLKVGKTDNV